MCRVPVAGCGPALPTPPRSWQSCRDVPVAWSLQGGEVAPAGLREPPLTAPEPLATVTPRFSASRVRYDHTCSRQGHQRSVPSTAALGTPPPFGSVLFRACRSLFTTSAPAVCKSRSGGPAGRADARVRSARHVTLRRRRRSTAPGDRRLGRQRARLPGGDLPRIMVWQVIPTRSRSTPLSVDGQFARQGSAECARSPSCGRLSRSAGLSPASTSADRLLTRACRGVWACGLPAPGGRGCLSVPVGLQRTL